jgi:hypothetical protein
MPGVTTLAALLSKLGCVSSAKYDHTYLLDKIVSWNKVIVLDACQHQHWSCEQPDLAGLAVVHLDGNLD